ncbi:MAG: hypothetical protein F4029_05350 [Gammaproteobacteria bacterium]|nr:hypothetical protein [Gammaproteobacteria bacterium]MXY57035.1 hypothetical protein [Gammaproteobacteria bacterium]MYK45633.1 hypothetical protein [Gammaproteobacteria bacterium]
MNASAANWPALVGRWIVEHRCALGSVVLVAVLWWLLLPWKSNAATWCEAFGLADFYREIGDGGIGRAIGESLWLFPVIEVVHLFGLAVLGGSVIVMDLRLLGVGLKNAPPARVLANTRPWFFVGLVVMIATGVPLFLSETTKCCFNHSFEVKITALFLAVPYTLAVRNRVAVRDGVSTCALQGAAVLSLGLWFTVAAAGRWIGFSG